MDSGSRITGGGSGYAAILAHAGEVLYGMELGSVTLKRIGFFCFPIKHSTHTGTQLLRAATPKSKKSILETVPYDRVYQLVTQLNYYRLHRELQLAAINYPV